MIIKNKIPYILIFIGLFYSISISLINTLKYDEYRINSKGNKNHMIVRTDVAQYWNSAQEFKTDIENGKNFFMAGEENRSIYLYPKIIGTYFMLIDQKIKDEKNMFVLNNYKFGIPIIQSIFYYTILTFLYFKLKNLFNQRVTIFVIGFLSLEPTITQYHGSYWTESIYFSLLLVILTLLLNLKKKFSYCFFLGFMIGISCLQRNVSIYLIIPIVIYLLINFKKDSFTPIISCLVGYSLIIFFLGFTNFIRSGSFYIIPWDQKHTPYYLVAHKLNKETNEEKNKKRFKWIKENNINIEIEEDRLKLADYLNQYFKKALKENFLYFIKYHIWKSLQALILDPFTIQNEYSSDKTIKYYWEKYFYQFYYKIPYSLVIYSLCLIGFLSMIKYNNENRKLAINILLICSLYVAVLGWPGTPRYLVPNLIFLSFYFGFGLDTIINYIKKHR